MNDQTIDQLTGRIRQLIDTSVTSDINISKQELGLLLDQYTLLNTVCEGAPDAIVEVDNSGRIMMINEQTEQLFGYMRDELLGKPIEVLIPERFRKGHISHRTHYTKEPRKRPMGQDLDLVGRRKDGQEFPVEISLSPIETKNGQLVVSSIRDITHRKQLEDQLRQHTVELEEKVLHTERLAAVGRMAAQVAHEIRNPLSSIGLNIEMLADELEEHQWEKNEEAQSLINITLSEIERLNNVIHDYLQFARMPSQQLQPTSLNDLVNELAKFVQPEAQQVRVDVMCDLDEKLPDVPLDPGRIRQAILNCVRNAIEAMPDGGQLVFFSRLSDKNHVVLEITDNGPGISPDHQLRVFDPFYSTKDKGTGLGLPYVRQIVEEHEGRIDLDSTPDAGTTISISLPVYKVGLDKEK